MPAAKFKQKLFVNSQTSVSGRQVAAVVVLALGPSGIAFADDSSMSQWTGDFFACFNNLDSAPAKFNMARAPRMRKQDDMAKPSHDTGFPLARE